MLPPHGIIPPLVTPLTDSGTLDVSGFERLLAHVAQGGVDGVFVLGTTGEGPSLPGELKGELVRRSTGAGLPVLVGLIEASTDDALRLADAAANAGAAAVVLTPPFYFALTEGEVLGYLERVVPRLPLPVYLYNIPVFTKVRLEPQLVRAAAELPGVAGFKDSGGDVERLREVRRLVPELPVWWGPEETLIEALDAGAVGGITGGANFLPRVYVELVRAMRTGDRARVAELGAIVERVGRELYTIPGRAVGFLPGIKAALEVLGICGTTMAEPLGPLSAAERERLSSAAKSLVF
ncbi:MAG: dihydrodipicolinate synthase family protein [Bryobacteraceae bacterium]|nr:dihydrodipicolinate synthase family protein [Bryobacteraceae bacterium]